MKRPTKWSKEWWIPEIMELRRVYTSTAQSRRCDRTGVEKRDTVKKACRDALNKAKKVHWDDFLANAKKNDVWTAHQFTKQRTPNRVPGGAQITPERTEETIMQHLFP